MKAAAVADIVAVEAADADQVVVADVVATAVAVVDVVVVVMAADAVATAAVVDVVVAVMAAAAADIADNFMASDFERNEDAERKSLEVKTSRLFCLWCLFVVRPLGRTLNGEFI